MRKYELRTYHFITREAAVAYGQIWYAHIDNLKRLDIQTHGVFLGVTDSKSVVALVSYPESADVQAVTEQYMSSSEFSATMAVFDTTQFAGTEAAEFTPLPCSPWQ